MIKEIETQIEKIVGHPGVIEYLHREYDHIKWLFWSAETFLSNLQNKWYHMGGLFEKNYDKNFVHHWVPGAQELLTQWYMEAFKNDPPVIVPGETGCTVHYYSDKRAGTITTVEYSKTKKDIIGRPMPSKINISLNETKCIDYYASDYEILPELWKEMGVWTLRKNGCWYEVGHPMRYGELWTTIGERYHYIDPSF